ncbi:LLM class flavin-dependent oxidoreductase [Acidiferrimicrobium sp. IK]|uniref:LLM class flavin-dependent oxidoreductase n=1 Tax=Acidiferrimicrobium sp. IK TaxID=2871700 RepID=UPI0021CAF169|nr:LLM class flavin-dependent oxidoreductase [Acidiferrimicrobium sp. IK]
MFGLRFDFRNPAFAGTTAADRYESAITMAEWADRLGCVSITLSEHHGSPDGYLPSPLPVLAAMAARTTAVNFTVAALIAPFYDPLRLAEDMVVLDHLSRGRVDLIVAAGYVAEEFAMYGVATSERGQRVTEVVTTLKAAFSGEPFEYRGRRVKVTPAPYRPGGPAVMLGGSSQAAARRAARIADGFLPSVPEVWEFYQDERRILGLRDPGPCPIPPGPQTLALAEDVEAGWEQMGPYFLHETNAYGQWLDQSDGAGPYQQAGSLDDLKAGGQYLIVTPEEHVEMLRAAPFPFAMFHPLCGGIPPELAWSSLRLFEQHVLPAFA